MEAADQQAPRYTARTKDAAFNLCMWMTEFDVSVKALASDMGCHEQIVTRWRTGKCKPCRARAVKLELLTGGRVSAASWDV